MNKAAGTPYFAGRHVLLLQGPVGPFFKRLAKELVSIGAASVHRVNFNGGDWLFSHRGAINYRGKIEEWPLALERAVTEWRIDTIVLFGDCRPVHMPVHDLAERLTLDVCVFEEGYVRPNYVTFERHGVNSRSRLPRDSWFCAEESVSEHRPEREVGNTFLHAAVWAMLYYLAADLLSPAFPYYQHHRRLSLRETLPWVRSILRKWAYRYRHRGVQTRLAGDLSGGFFLVPLQVTTDSQVRVHSKFQSVSAFITDVVESFARHAPRDSSLVIKHHPLDRGYHDYGRLIRRLAEMKNLGDRLLYIHDQHLPTLLSHARGVVVINSTVGLSALHHGTPVKVMGDALYDLPGLTFQRSLESFWTASAALRPSTTLYHRYRTFLIRHTQINGSFYRGRAFDWGRFAGGWFEKHNTHHVARPLAGYARDDNVSASASSVATP